MGAFKAVSKKNLILRSVVGVVILFVLLFLAGIAVGYLQASGRLKVGDGSPSNLIVSLFSLAAVSLGVWVGALWMRSIDEAAQEAHKWAWYWGGSLGMAAGLGGLMLLSAPRSTPLELPSMLSGRTDPAAYMATGAFGILFIMLLGYMLAWGWWWLQRR